jgi:hypothetical protein
MRRFVVQYELPYTHRVQVGIEAETPEQAIAKAQALFDAGDIWDDTPDVPLLLDDYEEDGDAGVPLEFTIEQELIDGEPWPERDASALQLAGDQLARRFLNAYIDLVLDRTKVSAFDNVCKQIEVLVRDEHARMKMAS